MSEAAQSVRHTEVVAMLAGLGRASVQRPLRWGVPRGLAMYLCRMAGALETMQDCAAVQYGSSWLCICDKE